MLAASVVSILVAVHTLALLHRVIPESVKDGLPSVVRPFGRRLERIARWDMFRTMFEKDQIVVEGGRPEGPWYDLANPFVRGWDIWARIVDARLRKFHGRLRGRVRRERWAPSYLAHLCVVGQREHPDLSETHVVRLVPAPEGNGPGSIAPGRVIMFRYRCGDPVPPPGASSSSRDRRTQREAGGEGDDL